MKNGVLYFDFTLLVIELLIFQVWQFVNIAAPPKQTWSQRSETHFLYNQDIKSTMWQITSIIKKMEQVQTFSYFWSDDRYISQYTVYFVMSFKHIYDLLLCAIWVGHAYNFMLNFGPCVENVSII